MTQTVYRHTPEMGEISGFGGGYENACQDMLEAGVHWILENPDTELKGHTYQSAYGLFMEDSEDAKTLSEVITDAVDKDCTGAMHQAVMQRLFFIKANGWDKYVEELAAKKSEDR